MPLPAGVLSFADLEDALLDIVENVPADVTQMECGTSRVRIMLRMCMQSVLSVEALELFDNGLRYIDDQRDYLFDTATRYWDRLASNDELTQEGKEERNEKMPSWM
jgi:hypothetical protein